MNSYEFEKKFRELHFYCMVWQHNEPIYIDVMETFDGASFYDCIKKYDSIMKERKMVK